MLPGVTIIMITLSSLGDLFIYSLRGKNLDPALHYSALGIAGTFLLAKTWEAWDRDIHMSWGSPRAEGGHIHCVKGAWEEF